MQTENLREASFSKKMAYSAKLHIAMFPWFAMGHITPFLHLANELAARGHCVSFLLPKKAQTQLQHLNLHPDLIAFHIIIVPHVAGLPAGTETASDIPLSLNNQLATAFDLTIDQVRGLLESLNPDFVFYDTAHWVPDLAASLSFKTVCYNVVSASSLAIALVPSRQNHPTADGPPPGYPSSTVVLNEHESQSLSFIYTEYGSGLTFYDRLTTAMKKSDAIAVRTCREIEGGMCEYLSEQYSRKPVLLTGYVLPEPDGTRLDEKWDTWLSQFGKSSVIYCAFGSQIILKKEQFQELVLGLEMTGLPFFAAIKPPLGTAAVEEGLPEGFKERVKGRGVVYGGWVEQPLILNHASVGCFVNHCGFGSMWESLTSECQIVMVPHLIDQVLNSRLLAAELKIGVEVKKAENGEFTKENLCKAIMCVMDEDNEVGELLKRNHSKWKQILSNPRLKTTYIDEFIYNLYQL